MIKKLSIVFAALLAVMSIHAQDEKPRHEIGVSYGLGVSLIGDGIGNAIGTGIFEIGFSGYKWTNRKEFGTLGVEYFYHLADTPRAAIGGLFIDCQFETPHLKSMGGKHISYDKYMEILNKQELC